jgi:7-carboxy-7-deazaguanine synthase
MGLETAGDLEKHLRKIPIAEIFGPTIQGEGIDQGIPAYFIRTGGCDYKCEWCDTPHAVLPQRVRYLDRLDEDEILERVEVLTKGPQWVVLTGGNPALHELGGLVDKLYQRGLRSSVETQGTRYKKWLMKAHRVCVSPKPPSSGMKWDADEFFKFLQPFCVESPYEDGWWVGRLFIKVVIFDHADYEWAKELYLEINERSMGVSLPFFMSAGNDAGATVGNPGRKDSRSSDKIKLELLERSRWLVNRVMVEPLLSEVRVQSQYHVLLWGNELGR